MNELFLVYSFQFYFYEIMQGTIRLKIIILLFLLFKINTIFSQSTVFNTIRKWEKAINPSIDTVPVNTVSLIKPSADNHSPQTIGSITMNRQEKMLNNFKTIEKILFSYPLKKLMITSHFGYRIHPVTGNNKFHNGIDLKAFYEPVFAVFSGSIEQAGWGEKEGYYVIVKHAENVQTIYCHLAKTRLQKNESVQAGQVIGISGNTGQSTGPHLHFAVRFKEAYIDPVKVFDIFQD